MTDAESQRIRLVTTLKVSKLARFPALLEIAQAVRITRFLKPIGVPISYGSWNKVRELTFDSRPAGSQPTVPSIVWCEPHPPHSVENVGVGELLVLAVELKS
jgi:hypothetical protein